MQNVRLLSNRVKKVPSTEVGNSRYTYLSLDESEPDLGVPAQDGNLLLSSTVGTRNWSTKIRYDASDQSLVFHEAYALRGSTDIAATTNEVVISTFDTSDYGSAKLTIQVYNRDTGERQTSEILVVHDSILPTATEYAIVYTGDTPLATFDVDMDSSTFVLKATGTTNDVLEYKVIENLILGFGTAFDDSTLAIPEDTIADNTLLNATNDENTTLLYPTMVGAAGVDQTVKVTTNKLYFNANTGTLNVTNLNTLSDMALKTNIKKIDNSLDIIKSLNGVGFNWNDTGEKSYGVIAQDVEKVIPEAIGGDHYKTVNYNAIVPFLIESIKELTREIAELKAKK